MLGQTALERPRADDPAPRPSTCRMSYAIRAHPPRTCYTLLSAPPHATVTGWESSGARIVSLTARAVLHRFIRYVLCYYSQTAAPMTNFFGKEAKKKEIVNI
ncbi:hypothetical protein EVAR_54158_1 [Eumeta japonica]|uniref:Uncharacterized protein n=1 Tax=Eumeta variegata TaxID=151549 RepID=A0A4C1Y3S1_EUMVA|nr:hypothetical protein EVAR_54158_1 [Eumeta japonica]